MMSQHDHENDERFETGLRKAAGEIHPRAAFVQGLRRELNSHASLPQPWYVTARRYIPQAAALGVLFGLLALSLLLTPNLVQEPSSGTAPLQGTALPGQSPPTINGDGLPNGALARLGRGQILALDVASDGRLAVASTMGVCLYDQDHVQQWCVEMGSPYSLAWLTFNPAGDHLALAMTSAAPDGLSTRALVLDAASGAVLAERAIANDQQIIAYTEAAIAWDPTGQPRLALPGANTTLNVWDWQANENILGPLDVSSLVSGASKGFAVDWALDPQGRALLAAGGSEGLLIVDTITGIQVLHTDRSQPSVDIGEVSTLDFSADGSWLAYGYASGAAAVRIEGDQIADRREWRTRYQPRQMAFGTASMENVLAVQEFGYVSLFSLEVEPKSIARVESGYGPFTWDAVGSLYFLREDGLLGSQQDGDDLVVPMQYSNWPEHIAWNSLQNIISLRNASVTNWDAANAALGAVSSVGEPVQNLDDIAISADGTRAAYYVNGADAVEIWDLTSIRLVARVEPVNWKAQAAFSKDHSRLVTIDRTGSLIVWDALSGRKIREMRAAPSDAQIDVLALAPDGIHAALGWYDKGELGLDIWNLESAQVSAAIALDTNAQALAFSPDSALLAVSSSGYVGIYDAATGQKVQSMGPEFYDMGSDVVYRVPDSQIRALAWSPDGQTIATGGGLVMLWDVQAGLPVKAFGGHGGYVNDLAYRPDGLVLASASNDGTILLWDTGAGPQPTAEPMEATATPQPPVITEVTVTEPTAEPSVFDLTGRDVTKNEFHSPDGQWTAEVLLAQPQDGAERSKDYHLLAVRGPSGELWAYEYWTDALSTRSGWSDLKWVENAVYWYQNTSKLDICHADWSTHLRRMDLTTGVVTDVPGFGPDWQGSLSFSPDTAAFASLEGTELVTRSLEDERLAVEIQRIPFEPISPNTWGVRAVTYQPGDAGVVMIQHSPENLMCSGGPVQEGVVVFDLISGTARQQPIPDGYQFRGYDINGIVDLFGPDEMIYLMDMQTGAIELAVNDSDVLKVETINYDVQLIEAETAGLDDDQILQKLWQVVLESSKSDQILERQRLIDYEIHNIQSDEQLANRLQQESGLDAAAWVIYSVRPLYIRGSEWVAGNGEIDGDWVRNKQLIIGFKREAGMITLRVMGTGP